jgi:pyruvate/2-oxoglutarate dehydrogenase complex dihydrolipoamide acyltransferase (E2) component
MMKYLKRVIEYLKANRVIVIFCASLSMLSGILTAILIVHQYIPRDLRTADEPDIVPITTLSSDDSRSVHLQLEGGGSRQVSAGVSGVVTKLGLSAFNTVHSGDALIEINGEKITFLHTATPPFAGAEHTIWIPEEQVKISAVNITLGDTVQVGQPILAVQNPIEGAKITDLPTNLIPGDRELNLGDVRIPVSAGGEINTPENLLKIATSAAYGQFLRANSFSGQSTSSSQAAADAKAMQVNLALKTPTSMTVVPPGAIIANPSSSSCVFSEGKTYNLDIIGSELGRTYVKFKSGEQPQNAKYHPDQDIKCQ